MTLRENKEVEGDDNNNYNHHPNHLADAPAEQMEALIREGWFPNTDVLIAEALRRFLDTHRAELMERFIREDVAWGLHGTD